MILTHPLAYLFFPLYKTTTKQQLGHPRLLGMQRKSKCQAINVTKRILPYICQLVMATSRPIIKATNPSNERRYVTPHMGPRE